MKTPKLHLALAGLLSLAGATVATAQFDDVYYDPSDVQEVSIRSYDYDDDNYDDDVAYADTGYDSDFVGDNHQPARYDDVARYGESDFDNEPITTDDYTGYEYSSRIRRFNRPYQGFGYYDPVYVDQLYYDGFGRPIGQTALIYNSPYAFNSAVRFNRFNRFNRFGNAGFYDPFAFNRFNRFGGGFYDPFSPFNDPFYGGASAFGWGAPVGFGAGFGRFGGAGFGAAGFGGGYYCPPTWGNTGVAYNTPNAVSTRRSSVSERSGTRNIGTRTTARPTNRNRATVPTRRATTAGDKDRARGTSPSSRSTRSTRSTTPATRSNGRVAPSRSSTRGSRSTQPSSRSSRPTAPRERTTRSSRPSTRSSRPSYSAPRSSRPSTRSSRPSYSSPRSSSPRSSSSRSSSPRSSSSRSSRSPR